MPAFFYCSNVRDVDIVKFDTFFGAQHNNSPPTNRISSMNLFHFIAIRMILSWPPITDKIQWLKFHIPTFALVWQLRREMEVIQGLSLGSCFTPEDFRFELQLNCNSCRIFLRRYPLTWAQALTWAIRSQKTQIEIYASKFQRKIFEFATVFAHSNLVPRESKKTLVIPFMNMGLCSPRIGFLSLKTNFHH